MALAARNLHALIGRVDNDNMPGVLAVLTVDDLDAAGMGNLPCRAPTRNRDGQPVYVPPRPPLAELRRAKPPFTSRPGAPEPATPEGEPPSDASTSP